MNLEEALREAVEEFNRYHGSEGRARVLRVEGDRFVVEFRGSFCVTCGFYDYFEDFALLLADRGFRAGIVSVEEIDDGAVVEYRLLREGEKWHFAPERVVLILE